MKFRLMCLLLTAGIGFLSAGVVQHSFNFKAPEFYRQDGYDRISWNELTVITKPGHPELPVQPVQLLLPPGEEAVAVEITGGRPQILSGSHFIYPIQKPYPMSYQGEIEFVVPSEEIYGRNAFYPEILYSDLTTQYLRGHSVAILNISPLQYNPQTGEIVFYENMTVTVQTQTSVTSQRAFSNFYRADERTYSRLASLVINPEYIHHYPVIENSRDNDDYEYIIITPSQYLSSLTDFIQFKTEQGYHLYSQTIEDIYTEYTGVDNGDKVRNFIIDAYQNMGAEFILLVGDINLVPHRGFWINAGGTEDYNIPSELYYEGLDRVGTGNGPDWNTDGDNRWGEHSEADYLTEVVVGRISADNANELAAALNKQIMYQDAPVIADIEKALMVGENLNNSPVTWGGTYKDEIISGGYFNGYSTVGFPASITVNTLYERDVYWSVSSLQNHMNNGLNIINHLGHSNTDYNMKFYNNTVTNQNITANGIDHNYFVIYSQGCLPAAIDTDCIAEKFTTISNGCAAYVGNTRYGWYMPGGTNSSSQFMDRQFFNALFNGTASKISELNVASKEVGVSQCSGSAWFRWSYYCLITLGDPTLEIWTETPVDINAVYQTGIPIGSSEILFQTDTPFARIGLIQNGELLGRAVAGADGNVMLETFEPIVTPGDISVSIIGHNKTRHLGNMVVISNQPYVMIDYFDVNDIAGNGNSLPDYAESITLNMTLKNVGNQVAQNITAIISSQDTYVNLTNISAVFGDIPVQSSVTVADAFALDIADGVPDQHVAAFQLLATDGRRETWFSDFSLIINAPDFDAPALQVLDSSGNNNGILDPGESAVFIIPVHNIGHALSPDAMGILTCNDNLITIDSPVSNLGALEAGSSSNALFTVTADNSIELGTPVEFALTVMAGSYLYERSFIHQIGLIVEDFETGDFSAFPWEFSGSANWQMTTGAYEGMYSAKSGSIGNNAATTLKIQIDVLLDGEISFWRTVSSEANYDYLKFFIDGNMMGQWSGDVTWGQEVYPISAGSRLLEWSYTKDQAVTGGTDSARLDYIIFPPLGVIFPAVMTVNPNLLNVELVLGEVAEEIIEIGNVGGDLLNFSISFNNNPAWLSVDHLSGNVLPGQIDEVILTFDTNDLTAGQYVTAMIIADGMGGQIILPVNLLVVPGTGTGNTLIPLQTELTGNYPNPFNPDTNISFAIKEAGYVTIGIYNIKGAKVTTLVNENLESGYYTAKWAGRDDDGKSVASGVYFYKMLVDDKYNCVRKMILLK